MTRTFKSHTASASQYNLTRVLTLLVKVTARSFARTFSGNLLWQVYGIIGLTALRLCMSCVSLKRYAEEAPQLMEASCATHDLKIKRPPGEAACSVRSASGCQSALRRRLIIQ